MQRPAELLADVHSLDRLVALSGRARVLLSELTLQAGRECTRLHESARDCTRELPLQRAAAGEYCNEAAMSVTG